MRLPTQYRFTRREIVAIAIAALLIAIGLCLGLNYDPVWLGRLGALVIVVGVIFAVTDLPIALERRARAIAKVTNALVFSSWLTDREEEQHKTYTPAERDALWKHFEKLSATDIDREASIPRKRILLVEATIVCVGTLANGFGEWVVKTVMAMSC